MTEHKDGIETALTRRAFCVHACEAVSLAALGAVLHGCGGSSPTSPSAGADAPALPTINASVAGNVISLTIDAASALASVGAAALVRASNGMFLVSRTGQSAFTALTAICTHEGCTITGFRSPTYVCPCHGSQYSTSGTVITGPATTSLRQFAAQFNNVVLTIAT